jgi:O-methyltransferase domain
MTYVENEGKTTSTIEDNRVWELQGELLDMWLGYMPSRALHVAAELEIADHLSSGDKSTFELATLSNVHEKSLYRLLRLLSSKGVFQEVGRSVFSQTELSDLLRSDNKDSVRATVCVIDDAWWEAYGKMSYSIRTGKPSFNEVTGKDFFSYHDANPVVGRQFDQGMANHTDLVSSIMVACYDFSEIGTIVDVGGGRGAFLSEILKANSRVKGVLYDRPDVVGDATYIREFNLSGRCKLIGGDFFESVPENGDAYLLQHILHDFSDENCIKLIKNIRQSIEKGGKLLIIDSVIPNDNEFHPGKLSDLLMLVLLGGKERTLEEFTQILKVSGFKIEVVIPTPLPLSIIEARAI